MKGLPEIEESNKKAYQKYENEVFFLERLRNRLWAIGTTTPSEDVEIERLFNLLSPALQRLFVTAPVSNRDLIPASQVATYYHVYVDRQATEGDPIFLGGTYAKDGYQAVETIKGAYPKDSKARLIFEPLIGYRPFAVPAEVGEEHPVAVEEVIVKK